MASVAMLHPPSRAYVEPWTGDLFGEGGVEQDPHVYPASAAAGVHGNVIMSKLGNATAKYVVSSASTDDILTAFYFEELSLVAQHGNFCEYCALKYNGSLTVHA